MELQLREKSYDTNHHPRHRREHRAVVAMAMERTARNCESRAKNPGSHIELAVNRSILPTAVMPKNAYEQTKTSYLRIHYRTNMARKHVNQCY